MIHLGKKPSRQRKSHDWIEIIIGLRVQLEAAIKSEDYLTAISLRDNLKKLETDS